MPRKKVPPGIFVPAYAAGTRANAFEWFCRHRLVQSVDQFAGAPLILEKWQNRFFSEALAIDTDGSPYWDTVVLVVSRKNGKALALTTRIPTPGGWVTMGDLSEGDVVFDERGCACSVTFATGVQVGRDCFRVEFSDGSSVVADADHQWTVDDRLAGKVTLTTKQMREAGLSSEARQTHVDRRFSIPVCGALETPERDLPLDPYLLGAWLGDGSSADGRITFGETFVLEEIERCGYTVGPNTASANRAASHTVYGIRRILRGLGVLGDKHIPESYLRASRSQRLALLQGLMDTDGYASKAGQLEFTTTRESLADGFLELARSLGFKPSVKHARASIGGRDCGPKWRIQFWAFSDSPAFRMPRKIERQKDRPARAARSMSRQITAIVPVDSVPVKCITVDSPSSLYLAGDGMIPTHNTAMLGGYSLFQLEDEGSPEILLAASSDKQAGRLFDADVAYVRQSDILSDLLHLRDYKGEIARKDGMGKIVRMASDPKTAHGYNPSLVICDELHAWTTPTLKKAWGAFITGGGARQNTQIFAITTAGEALEREDGILGRIIDGNEQRGEVEQEPGLTVSRNHVSRTLVYNYSAPTNDRYDIASLKLANPASWITIDYLTKQAESPELTDAEVLQLHGCVWAAGEDQWITEEVWDSDELFEGGATIPDGADVYVGVDMSISEDCSAVAWAHPRADGSILVDAHVWAARDDVAFDTLVSDGDIDPRLIEDFICDVTGKRFRVREVVYDPALFTRSAKELGKRFTVAPVSQQSSLMAEAYQMWYSAVYSSKKLRHAGGKTLRRHVTNAVAEMTDRGWRVRKSKQNKKIDALVAAVMAHWRAAVAGPKPSVYETRGVLTFGADDEVEL